jgi:hypothetical protein
MSRAAHLLHICGGGRRAAGALLVLSHFLISKMTMLDETDLPYDGNQQIYALGFCTMQGSIFWKIPPPPLGEGKNISRCHWGEKYEKRNRKKGDNVKDKEKRR